MQHEQSLSDTQHIGSWFEGCVRCRRRLAPIRGALEAGRRAVEQLRNRCAYRWVSLGALYNVTATGA